MYAFSLSRHSATTVTESISSLHSLWQGLSLSLLFCTKPGNLCEDQYLQEMWFVAYWISTPCYAMEFLNGFWMPRHGRGTEWSGTGMARPRTGTARHGLGTAWRWHGIMWNLMEAFYVLFVVIFSSNFQILVEFSLTFRISVEISSNVRRNFGFSSNFRRDFVDFPDLRPIFVEISSNFPPNSLNQKDEKSFIKFHLKILIFYPRWPGRTLIES